MRRSLAAVFVALVLVAGAILPSAVAARSSGPKKLTVVYYYLPG